MCELYKTFQEMCKTFLNHIHYFSRDAKSIKKVKKMKTIVDFFNIQKQQLLADSNLFGGSELNPDYDARIKQLSENFAKIQKESKQSFVVDWQITENL